MSFIVHSNWENSIIIAKFSVTPLENNFECLWKSAMSIYNRSPLATHVF